MPRSALDRPARLCRACRMELGPDAAAAAVTCMPCWRRVPTKLRIAAVSAYKRRRVDPARHAEAQAGVLQWCADQATRLDARAADR